MKPARMAAIALSLSLASACPALAGSASGSPALALAAVIAPYSPDLSPLDKVTVADMPVRVGGALVVEAGRPGSNTD